MKVEEIEVQPISHSEQQAINKLIIELNGKTKGSNKQRVAKSSKIEYKGVLIENWKFTEHLFYKHPSPLPIEARGFFTRQIDKTNHRIQSRGYNKFFNINEHYYSKLDRIKGETKGPYELTAKENGCIIFISALDDKNLVISSKNSLTTPHAQMGEDWMNKHLALKNKSQSDFATFLNLHNVTAIFELCDDSFEEHVLPYSTENSGLYIHGINRNTVHLNTWPSVQVQAVAEEFGFFKTDLIMFHDLNDLIKFTDKVRKEELYNGRPIEGFVARSQMKSFNETFMFKIKFDEPYLMYREWREVTKAIMTKKKPKYKYSLTKQYIQWFQAQFATNPKLYEPFLSNHGIIETRERFLEAYNSGNFETSNTNGTICDLYSSKIVLMTVATIGCGKTTVAKALADLYSIGHIQNDNITVKKNKREAFHKAIDKHLRENDILIVDRNNQTVDLRKSLCDFLTTEFPGCRIVALYWDCGGNKQAVFNKAKNRVTERGENHQTLTPEKTPNLDSVLWNFLNSFTPINLKTHDGSIDNVIYLDPLSNSLENLSKSIYELNKIFPEQFKLPSPEAINKTLLSALEHKTEFLAVPATHRNSKKVVYYGLFPTENILSKVKEKLKIAKEQDQLVGNTPDIEESYKTAVEKSYTAFDKISRKEFVLPEHHITLIHRDSINDGKASSEIRLKSFADVISKVENDNAQVVVECESEYLVSSNNTFSLTVSHMKITNPESEFSKYGFYSILKPIDSSIDLKKFKLNKSNTLNEVYCTNHVPHITLAHSNDVKPRATNEILVSRFKKIKIGGASRLQPQPTSLGSVAPFCLKFKAVLLPKIY